MFDGAPQLQRAWGKFDKGNGNEIVRLIWADSNATDVHWIISNSK